MLHVPVAVTFFQTLEALPEELMYLRTTCSLMRLKGISPGHACHASTQVFPNTTRTRAIIRSYCMTFWEKAHRFVVG